MKIGNRIVKRHSMWTLPLKLFGPCENSFCSCDLVYENHNQARGVQAMDACFLLATSILLVGNLNVKEKTAKSTGFQCPKQTMYVCDLSQ